MGAIGQKVVKMRRAWKGGKDTREDDRQKRREEFLSQKGETMPFSVIPGTESLMAKKGQETAASPHPHKTPLLLKVQLA